MAKAAVKVPTYKNFIGGQWVKPASGQMMDNLNPANTREVVGRFPASTAADVEAAILRMLAGYSKWRQAIASYDKAIALKPDFVEAHYAGHGSALGGIGAS